MPLQPIRSEEEVLEVFQQRKILTIDELSTLMQCSRITSRRRLKQWRALTSYNQNNRFYTLPAIAQFDASGLWHYREVSFSQYGTCKQTVVHFVQRSEQGLSNAELAEPLGENPSSLLAHFDEIPGIIKERHGRTVVYFSSEDEVYRRQRRNRFPAPPSASQLPSDAEAVLILVELIHHPGMGAEELAGSLQRKGHGIEPERITALFRAHQIMKKKPSTKS